jgi:hypothetical protein
MKRYHVESAGTALPAQLRSALCLLLQAWDYATDCERDAWDFAIEIHSLRQQGLTNSDLRWLLCKGLTKHATENTVSVVKGRSFYPGAGLSFTDKTCFILTATGLSAARQLDQNGRELGPLSVNGNGNRPIRPRSERALVPHWDSSRRELRWLGELVKRYRLPAPNQEVILTAEEEEGWPSRMDDPLPRQPGQDPEQRLHDAIKNLNRHQINHLLVFERDGTGEGVQWRPLRRPLPRASPKPPHSFP